MAKKYIFKKTHEVDKDKFAELLVAAKGGRTMKDFAELCGANPSTFTRIVQKANKGASSPELIEAIAAHADPQSGVTVEALANANGYTLESDTHSRVMTSSVPMNALQAEALVRDVLLNELIARNQSVRMGCIRYPFSKRLELRPDALLMTDAFGKKDEIWFTDALPFRKEGHPNPNSIPSAVRHRAFDRISRFTFIAMSSTPIFKPTRFSLIVFDQEVFDIIVDEFGETLVATDISIIFIDPLKRCIVNEYMLPHTEFGNRDSYFMTTPTTSTTVEYIEDTIDETEDDE